LERIKSLRKDIDEIDERILHFLKDRVEICKTIGAIKREHGIPIRDQQREEEQYRNVMKRASEIGLDPHEVKAVYREIIAMGMHAQ
jgi:chorismate mutase/prephenate dehydrogenase